MAHEPIHELAENDRSKPERYNAGVGVSEARFPVVVSSPPYTHNIRGAFNNAERHIRIELLHAVIELACESRHSMLTIMP